MDRLFLVSTRHQSPKFLFPIVQILYFLKVKLKAMNNLYIART